MIDVHSLNMLGNYYYKKWFNNTFKIIKDFKMSVIIIAEVGINHNGNIDTCKKLIDVGKIWM